MCSPIDSRTSADVRQLGVGERLPVALQGSLAAVGVHDQSMPGRQLLDAGEQRLRRWHGRERQIERQRLLIQPW